MGSIKDSAMLNESTLLLTDVVQEAAHPLVGEIDDYDPLMTLIGDAPLVLLGEASHATHEFYRERAQITKRLIKEKGFSAVAVEADWPDAYRVNRYVRGMNTDADAVEALSGFKRFPSWMWRNADVLDFVGWLRTYNDDLPASATKVGFYGLDLYSLHTSIEAVLDYLDRIDPGAAHRARARYACFDHFGKDEQAYGYATGLGISESCEDEVVSQLLEIYQNSAEYAWRDGRFTPDEHFYATQNARLVMNAERYYRSIFRGRVSSWNLRDAHMVETLESLHRFSALKTPIQRLWSGSTTPTLVTRVLRAWVRKESGTSANLCANGIRVTRNSLDSQPIKAPSPQLPTGMHRLNASEFDLRWKVAMKRSSTTSTSRGSCSHLAEQITLPRRFASPYLSALSA